MWLLMAERSISESLANDKERCKALASQLGEDGYLGDDDLRESFSKSEGGELLANGFQLTGGRLERTLLEIERVPSLGVLSKGVFTWRGEASKMPKSRGEGAESNMSPAGLS